MSISSMSGLVSVLLAAGLVACASAPPPAPVTVALTDATPTAMVVAIRAAGQGNDELAVQPLRDTRVEDLREAARQHEHARRYAQAAQSLDDAIAIVADDPMLLQERAEVAVLTQDYAMAATLAERAFALGSQVGPLCRRHWKTIEQARLKSGDAAAAAAAGQRIDVCTVAAPNRF
ncbi:MAG TPA: hypothetical protein VLK29_12835, partial [Luteimonas sp.]|nr:hypothetical protein [Luteimonas sp.]